MTEGAPFDAGFPPAPRGPWWDRWRKLAKRQIAHVRDALPLGLAGVMGLGILAFFALPFDPAFAASVLVFGFALLLAVLMFGRSRRARWLTLLPTTFVFGFTAAAFQTQRLGDHLLHEPAYTVAITGTVQNVIWRSDGPRFLLRNIQSDRPELDALRSVQIKWRGLSEGDAKGPALLGQTIEWTVTLLPVRSAIVPGGFDFRRQAYSAVCRRTGTPSGNQPFSVSPVCP